MTLLTSTRFALLAAALALPAFAQQAADAAAAAELAAEHTEA